MGTLIPKTELAADEAEPFPEFVISVGRKSTDPARRPLRSRLPEC